MKGLSAAVALQKLDALADAWLYTSPEEMLAAERTHPHDAHSICRRRGCDGMRPAPDKRECPVCHKHSLVTCVELADSK